MKPDSVAAHVSLEDGVAFAIPVVVFVWDRALVVASAIVFRFAGAYILYCVGHCAVECARVLV